MSSRSSIGIFATATVILGLAAASPAAAQQRQVTHQHENADPASSGEDCVAGFADLYYSVDPEGKLSGWEETAVGDLWQEEKLARDVYDLLEDRWKLNIFGNVSDAEQNHMDMVSKLFQTYGLEFDFTDLDPGEFDDWELQGFYDSVELLQDSISLVEALAIGVGIEVESLCFLSALLEDTEYYHIDLVAQNLAKGTRNHVRAFVAAWVAQQEDPDAEYPYSGCLDEELFTAIVDGGRESGVVDANGEPIGSCAEQDTESDGRRTGGN